MVREVLLFFFISLCAITTLSAMLCIGDARKPITPKGAAVTFVVEIVVAYLYCVFYRGHF